MFEEVPCYISIQDRDLRIIEANRLHREAFGTHYGRKCYEVYKHRNEECWPCLVQQTFQDGKIRQHEEVVTSLKNEQINVLVCTTPIRNADGVIDRVIEMSADITQMRQLQDKLSSIGLLISSISHGIKGMLNGLDGGIYLVNSDLKKDDQARIKQGWEMAQRNVDRIRSMVLDILYYVKDRELNIQEVDAVDLVNDVCAMMVGKAGELAINLECLENTNPRKFSVDPQAMRSLLVNLIENSLDACKVDLKKDKHKVTITLSESPEYMIIGIADNGIGMDRETREKAFSLFFSSKGDSGTCLGLFIANKIAQAHNGRIKLTSEIDRGTKFPVEIPKNPFANPTESPAI